MLLRLPAKARQMQPSLVRHLQLVPGSHQKRSMEVSEQVKFPLLLRWAEMSLVILQLERKALPSVRTSFLPETDRMSSSSPVAQRICLAMPEQSPAVYRVPMDPVRQASSAQLWFTLQTILIFPRVAFLVEPMYLQVAFLCRLRAA